MSRINRINKYKDHRSQMSSYEDIIADLRGGCGEFEVSTSGSTGTPKLIKLRRCVMERSARRSISWFGLSEKDYLYSCISPDTIGGKMMCMRAYMCGADFGWETPSNAPSMRSTDARGNIREISLVSVVPSQMIYVTRHVDDFRHVRRFLVGGQAVPSDLVRNIELLGLHAWESYGMTETASHIALRRVSADVQPFRPLEGINISQDQRGCLVIEGAGEEPVITNDLVTVNPDGSFYVIGRADDVIITGGKKVHPSSLEQEIGNLLSLECRYMIIGLPDDKWGEKVVLVLEGVHLDAAGILGMLHTLRRSMEGWKCPKEIVVVDEFAASLGSKLKRREIRRQVMEMQ